MPSVATAHSSEYPDASKADKVEDATEEFRGIACDAAAHFSGHPDDRHKKVKEGPCKMVDPGVSLGVATKILAQGSVRGVRNSGPRAGQGREFCGEFWPRGRSGG